MTDNTAKRTPGPWERRTNLLGFKSVRSAITGDTIFIEGLDADCDFIVNACNNHDALLAGCKLGLNILNFLEKQGVFKEDAMILEIHILRTAILNAEK